MIGVDHGEHRCNFSLSLDSDAESRGESVNAFIARAIAETIKRDNNI